MRRIQGRVTRDDIRSAGLRRWDGRARITTDWVNVFHVSGHEQAQSCAEA